MLKLKVFVCANVNCKEKIHLRSEKCIWSTKKYTNTNCQKVCKCKKVCKCEKWQECKKII